MAEDYFDQTQAYQRKKSTGGTVLRVSGNAEFCGSGAYFDAFDDFEIYRKKVEDEKYWKTHTDEVAIRLRNTVLFYLDFGEDVRSAVDVSGGGARVREVSSR